MRAVAVWVLGLVGSIGASGCGPDDDCALPDGVEGVSAIPDACADVLRIGTHPVSESLRDTLPAAEMSYTYLFRDADGTLTMIDAGYTHEAIQSADGTVLAAVNETARGQLQAMVRALEPGATLAAIDQVVLEHGHLDHMMQVTWLAAAREDAGAGPLPVFVGTADVPLVTGSMADCTQELPEAILSLVPDLSGDAYEIRSVSDVTDLGPDIELIPAPSHTPGTLVVHLPDRGVTIGSDHLVPSGESPCETTDVSTCQVDCATYDATRASVPDGTFLPVHPL